jgi:hypothetical protein
MQGLSQKTLNDYLNSVSKDFKAGKYTSAINRLQKDVLTKTDGCASSLNKPDKNDLIVKCPAQTTVYSEVNHIIQELQALQGS